MIFTVAFGMHPFFTRASAIFPLDYNGPPPSTAITWGITTTYLYEYSYTITRTGLSDLNREMWIPALGNRTLLSGDGSTVYQQQVTILNESWGDQGPPVRIVDSYGNSMYYFDLAIPGQSTWALNVVANLTLRTVTWNGYGNVSTSMYNASDPLYSLYTREEEFTNKSHPLIASNATLLNDTSPFKTAKNVYDFVTQFLSYSLQDEEHGAEWAIEHGTGDCTEFSCLMVALLRACGIPARVLRGIVIADSSLQGVNPEFDAPVNSEWSFDWVYTSSQPTSTLTGHAWVEYFIPGYGWIISDPTWSDAYNYTSHVDNVHVPFIAGMWIGEGIDPPLAPGDNPTDAFSSIPYPIWDGDPGTGTRHEVSFDFRVIEQQTPPGLLDDILRFLQENQLAVFVIIAIVLLVVIFALLGKAISKARGNSSQGKRKVSFSEY